MARITEVTLKQTPAHYMVTMRKNIDFMAEYSTFAEETLAKTGALLTQNGLFPISGPVVCFHNTDLTALDVEMGWQVVTPIETTNHDGIICQPVPTQIIAAAIDLGPYEEQDPTLMDLLSWVQDHGYEMQGPIYYCYLNDTNRPESELLTQMFVPVK